ncbi:MAG: hypothetical protein J6O41_05975 [Clostridia bacterium]|nr:hypothetical protein [Clostridia bacterium]
MFKDCISLTSLDLKNFNAGKLLICMKFLIIANL